MANGGVRMVDALASWSFLAMATLGPESPDIVLETDLRYTVSRHVRERVQLPLWGDQTMKDIGCLLRERREELGLSLADIQKTTKVHSKWLVALEDGDENAFPAEAYLKGFLRSYAEAVGLDGLALVQDWAERRRLEEEESEAQNAVKQPPRWRFWERR